MPHKRELLRAWGTSALTGVRVAFAQVWNFGKPKEKIDERHNDWFGPRCRVAPFSSPRWHSRRNRRHKQQKLRLSFGAPIRRGREGRSVSEGEDASSSSTSKTHALSSRPTAQHVQAMRRRQHLRARAAAQPVQGVSNNCTTHEGTYLQQAQCSARERGIRRKRAAGERGGW